MRTPRSLFRAFAATLAATLATTLLTAPAAAAGTPGYAVDISSYASCQRATGKWQVRWQFQTESMVKHYIERVDGSGGASTKAVGSFWYQHAATYSQVLPGTTTSVTIVAKIRKEGRTEAVDHARTLPLGKSCAPDTTPPSECVSATDARYQHTFDNTAGHGSIEIVSKPLCAQEKVGLALWTFISDSRPAWSSIRDLYFDFDSTVSRIVAQTEIPTCAHTLYFQFQSGDSDTILGSGSGAGSRSTGPYGKATGGEGACVGRPSVTVESMCNGDFAVRLSNDAAANWHAFASVDSGDTPQRFYDQLRAVPGETHEVISRHDDATRFDDTWSHQYDTTAYWVYQEGADGESTTRHEWKRPMSCPLRHNDITDDNRSDLTFLQYDVGPGYIHVIPSQSGAGRVDAAGWLGDSATFPWSRFRAFSGDFSGDHRMDLLAIRSEQAGRVTMHRAVSTGIYGSSSFAPVTQVWDSGVNGWWLDRMQPVVGDFNADGYGDVAVFYRYDGARTALWLFDGTTDGISAPRMVWDSGVGNWNAANATPYATDVNGDGKTDVGAMYRYTDTSTGAWSWLSNGTGFTTPFRAWQHNSWSLSRSKIVTGDFNADGKGDVAMLYSYADWEWKLWTMTGRADGTFDPVTVWYTHPKNWADPTRITLSSGDFDGDGRGDIGYLYRYPTAAGSWHSTSSGTTFAGPAVVGTRQVGSDPTLLLP